MKFQLISFQSLLALIFMSCGGNMDTQSGSTSTETESIPAPAALSYTLLHSYPHDTSAFTQGLEIYQGKFIESTGLMGRSTLRTVDIKTGKHQNHVSLGNDIFAEGVTVFRDTVYQLTWQNHEVYIYDAKNGMKKIGTLPWSSEGWGITHDSSQLIISEGSDKLYFVTPGTLKLKSVLSVRDSYGPVNNLNELEMIGGYIYANRWQYDYILKIDPKTGLVVGTLAMDDFLRKNSKADLSYLTQRGTIADNGAVLNGIAHDPATGKTYITGKLWPEVFEIEIVK